MPKAKVLLPILILAGGALATVIIIKARPKVERERPASVPLLVRVQTVQPQTVALKVLSQGTVQPSTAATLVAEVAGKVVWVAPSFAAGGFFRKGEPLVRLDSRDYELAVTQAEAASAQSNVRLEQVLAEADLALREWGELAGDVEAPPLAARRPQIAEARAGQASAQAALEAARLRLDRTVVRAPYAGRVRGKQADVGQYVAPGQPLGAVYGTDFAEVRLPVPDDQLFFLDLALGPRPAGAQKGPAVELTASFAGRPQSWPGRIVRTEGEIDPQSRMVQLVARVEDPYGVAGSQARPEGFQPLAVGLFVQAEIDGPRRDGLFVLSRTALREGPSGQGDYVLVLEEGSKLRYRQVQVLRSTETEVLIQAGLEAGEKVCVSPLEAPVDGMEVRSVEEPQPAAAEAPDAEEIPGGAAAAGALP